MDDKQEKKDLVIDVKNLCKSFEGKPAVVDVSLQVRTGEIFGFLGPNGSGKTTTIRMLCGLLTPDSGEGHCLGYDILTQAEEIKRKVGYMTQKFSLYEDLTVQQNLDFVGRIYEVKNLRTRINEVIDQLDFKRYRYQLAGQLSGGWKQRLALAAALLHRPKLLLLDEPTAGVDPQARRDFWDQIHYLAVEGITSLVSTHYMDEVERCHRIAYILKGHLLMEGSVQDVINQINLITWQVTGPDLPELAKKLEQEPDIEQVSIFGNSLHVSSKDDEKLRSSIAAFKEDKNYQWKKIKPGIEDIFISLVGKKNERDD